MKEIISHVQQSFSDLQFKEEGHLYTLKEENLTPATTVINKFYEGFDTVQKSIEYAERHGGNAEDIARGWKETGDIACSLGTKST